MALVLLTIQSSEAPITCIHHSENSTISSKSTTSGYILDTCLGYIKDHDENSGTTFLILDEFLGWFLALEIICLMIITKTIARNNRNKQICRRFTELADKFENSEEEDEEKHDLIIDKDHLFNKNNIFLEELRQNNQLSKTHIFNSGICIVLSMIFFALGIPS